MRHTLVDTSVIVEYPKADEFISKLLTGESVLFINPAVFSGVIYVMIGHYSGKAPRTIKGDPERLPKELGTVFQILSDYAFVEVTRETTEIAKELIEKHAMLPNDALILATCLEHGFALATLDDDFKLPAEKEGVPIITG